ncbi:hypothetical protein PPH41_32660, partial [Burkholderia gladioli]|nr:hypothetical protein [Burkholderia gladioli]
MRGERLAGLNHARRAFSIPTSLLMMKDLSLRRFSNFESATVREPQRLAAALRALEGVVGDPVL